MMQLVIDIDDADLAAAHRRLTEFASTNSVMRRDLVAAEVRAVNRTLNHGRAVSSRIMRKHITMRHSAIKRRMRVFKATAAHPAGTLRFTEKPIALMSFNHRQTRAGVSVQAYRNRPPVIYPRTFMPRDPIKDYQRRMVFKRAPGPGPTGLVPRMPIVFQRDMSMAELVSGAPGALNDVRIDLSKWLAKELDAAVKYYMITRPLLAAGGRVTRYERHWGRVEQPEEVLV